MEINGKNKFYPYSTRFNNFTNLKYKTTLANGYNLLNLNSWKLEGFIKYDDGKDRLRDLLTKTIKTYEERAKSEKEAA